jgi:ABC-type multidrug transport system fused ATPase/permease subunit
MHLCGYSRYVRQSAELESQVISVERLEEYAVIESEAPPIVEGHSPPTNWPTKGDIAFERTAMRYRPNLPLVLRGKNDQGLVCTIHGGQKVSTWAFVSFCPGTFTVSYAAMNSTPYCTVQFDKL